MDNQANTPQEDNHSDWAQSLEQLRQNRRQTPYTRAPAEPEGRQKEKEKEMRHKLDARERDRVLREYLLQWQKEHNEALEQEENVETDTDVLLQENWLGAQASLQMAASDKQIESTRTVWLNPKRQSVEFPDSAEAQQAEKAAEEGGEAPDVRVNVTLNVLNPQVSGRREVLCLSETELLERLTKRLRPHLTDAVNGMIRVAVQKQMVLMTHQLQQALNEQAPALVEEILDHNLKKVMSEIKYDLKYRRKS